MRNLVIALAIILGLIWLFFNSILLGSNAKNSAASLGELDTSSIINNENMEVDVKKLAKLLNVEYQERNIIEESVSKNFDVELGVVLIYTSENNHKVRVRVNTGSEQSQIDMVVGDKLYNYTLTEITPSTVVLVNEESNIILKIFEQTVISVTDLPKELPESL